MIEAEEDDGAPAPPMAPPAPAAPPLPPVTPAAPPAPAAPAAPPAPAMPSRAPAAAAPAGPKAVAMYDYTADEDNEICRPSVLLLWQGADANTQLSLRKRSLWRSSSAATIGGQALTKLGSEDCKRTTSDGAIRADNASAASPQIIRVC